MVYITITNFCLWKSCDQVFNYGSQDNHELTIYMYTWHSYELNLGCRSSPRCVYLQVGGYLKLHTTYSFPHFTQCPSLVSLKDPYILGTHGMTHIANICYPLYLSKIFRLCPVESRHVSVICMIGFTQVSRRMPFLEQLGTKPEPLPLGRGLIIDDRCVKTEL